MYRSYGRAAPRRRHREVGTGLVEEDAVYAGALPGVDAPLDLGEREILRRSEIDVAVDARLPRRGVNGAQDRVEPRTFRAQSGISRCFRRTLKAVAEHDDIVFAE